MALALYRRYRPDTFEGVIGQDQVTVPLMRALDDNRLTHAYLFSGPRGCGKTSSARILARCINCVNGPTSTPCGVCDSCRDLATGGPGSIDVVEIDAASHNGVDDARELRERAGFAPARDRYKIFILDEAHMVTQQGFNALLKIVEEPPEHVMFIFATTEPDKVIGTIRSRTHHYPFRLVPQEIMGPYLEGICEQEHIQPEPGVLRLAMRAGGGSVRDTLSVLDQLMVGAVDGSIQYSSAVALLGFTPDVLIGNAIDAIVDQDGAALYGVIQKVVVGGFDPRRFVEDLLARTRDLLVLTLSGDQAESVLGDEAATEDLDDMRRQAAALGLATLTGMAKTMDDTLAEMTGAVSPRMRLELLAARLMAGRELGFAPVAMPVGAAPAAAGAAVAGAGLPDDGSASAKTRSMAAAQSGGGFVGSRKQATATASTVPTTSAAPTTAPAQAAAPAAEAPATVAHGLHDEAFVDDGIGGFGASAHAGDAAPRAGKQSHAGGQAPASAAPAAPATGGHGAVTVGADKADETWDRLVASLPEDVAQYVNRTKVPRVLLSMHRPSGHMRLWIKFDKPLSKYAFALAVAKETVDNTNSVQKIVRAKVREFFGDGVQLAPTEKMADGQAAPPFGKLDAAAQQKIKAELLKENLRNSLKGQAPVGVAPTTADSGSRSDGQATGGQHASSDASEGGDEGREPSDSGRFVSGVSDDGVDPWATPAGARSVAGLFDHQQETDAPAQAAAETTHHRKQVAVPDPDDDFDPWANAPAPAEPFPDPRDAEPAPEESPFHPDMAPGMDAEASFHPDEADSPSGDAEQDRPSGDVRPEDDSYSLADQSLDAAGDVGIDELKKMFDVRKVEEFSADDPHNPKNMHAKKEEA
ncbi:DNA polymerase III subunit gamma/tau [Bifidobacterium choloepi]|uniref:DNA-directed DNA polymerase n=1 Tax=Bifidobacterium choloepi TaxID=2614131 RepID=A0A6I5NEQ9_9BIFI|nr:DNA polymerase III subunit gamma/tau [Bifidobacterium choloepi]NEG69834.1 DNA polymerase III subunit gamma/tau [Bifidobacterium choloepi]